MYIYRNSHDLSRRKPTPFFPFQYPVIIRNSTFLHFIGVVCVYRYSNLTNVASKNNMNVKPQVLFSRTVQSHKS